MKILNAVCSLLVALPAFAEEGLVLDYAAVLSPAVEKQESENNWHRVKALAIASAKKEKFALVLEKEFVVFSRDALDPTRELVGLVTPDREGTFSPRASRRDFGLRIATVDMGRAALATKLGQAAREQLKADVASRQMKLDVEQKAVKELSRRTETLSRKSAAYEQNMKELLVRTRALKTLTESGNSELQLAERAAIITLMQKLRPLVAALAERDGYSLVLDPYDADLVYADDDMDLTGEVIRLSDAGGEVPKKTKLEPRPLTKFGAVDSAELAKARPKDGDVTRTAQRLGLNLVFSQSSKVLLSVRPDLNVTAAFTSELSAGKKSPKD